MSSMTESWDPYLYPGIRILKNLRGLSDPELLERFEARRTHRRIAELIDTPAAGRFDVAHLKAIHRYIFQDVYEWAGQFRTVNISKGGHLFAAAAFLEPALQQTWKSSRPRATSSSSMPRRFPIAPPIFWAS
jgi:cell filamentation protein